MFSTKVSESFSFMPTGGVYPQNNDFALKTPINTREKSHKNICIAFFMLHYAVSTSYRIQPTRNIYSFLMLAACINHWLPFAFLKPDSFKVGMQRKSYFIGKKNNPVFNPLLNHQEFFLRRYGIPLLPPLRPGQNGKLVVSIHIQVREAFAKPGVDVSLLHDTSSNIQQLLSRPSVHGQFQKFSVIYAGPD
jgi:hypothetical protein